MIKVGDMVVVKNGASQWMKTNGYFLDEYPSSIDGYIGIIAADYTYLHGDDSHYIVNILNHDLAIGIKKDFLSKFGLF